MALHLSKSERGSAEQKISMGLAQMAVGTDDDEGIRGRHGSGQVVVCVRVEGRVVGLKVRPRE